MAEQIRNDEMVELLKPDFPTRDEFYRDGARINSAVLSTHRAFDGTQGAGGNLIEGWLADSRQVHGTGCVSTWTENNMGFANYGATTNGGPYATFDATQLEYLSIADAAWQEAGTEEILTWRWCNPADAARIEAIIGKYLGTGNQRSWLLWLDGIVANRFYWTTNALGTNAGDVVLIANTFGAPIIGAWHFVAGYFQASTLMRIWVGLATDDALSQDSLAVGVPASVFNGTASLTVGAISNPSLYWHGEIGIGHTRFNVPATNIDAHVARLFHLTRWFYQA